MTIYCFRLFMTVVYIYILYWQKSYLTLGSRIYPCGSTGVIIYERLSNHLAHYSSFVKSVKDKSKWFYTNNS